jgi:Glycosyl transferase family 90
MLYSQGNSTEPFGYADKSLRRHFLKGVPINKYMLSYRYLVVIAGVGSADRLNTFLAHSGAVILLQETDFLYHYSAFLRPWVHYGKLT